MKTYEEIVDTIRATRKHPNVHPSVTFADVGIDGNKYRPLFEPYCVPEQGISGGRGGSFPYSPGDILWDIAYIRAFVWNYPNDPHTTRSLEFSWGLIDAQGMYGTVTFSLYNGIDTIVPIVAIYEFMETGYEGHHFPSVTYTHGDNLLELLNEDFGE